MLDGVGDALEVLDVDGGDHVDAGVKDLEDVLPALGVARSGDVGVGQLVDERHFRMAGEHGVEVHLLEAGAPVVDDTSGDDLQVVAQLLR